MKYVLAPLAGFTDAAFRRLCHEGGADLTYTEMVSAAALAHGHSPTLQLLTVMAGEGPVACQIFGATESEIAAATREIDRISSASEHPFAELNLNAGCPMANITRCGAGSELAKDPPRVFRLLRAMKENTSLPVTLKTRLGPHPQAVTAFELTDAAQQAGAAGIVFHARYTSQCHGGPTDLDTLKAVVERAEVPIVGNGGVTDAASARAMAATGVAGVMIGRAALANPNLFRQLKEGLPITRDVVAARTHLRYLLEYHALLRERFPEAHLPSIDSFAAIKMHTHLFRYFGGRPGAAALRARLNSIRTLAEIEAVFNECGHDGQE